MASRDRKDLNYLLVEAFDKAVKLFSEKHPDLPIPFLTCTYRSNEEQNKLYEQGVKDPKKKVTNAKGGQSPHNYKPSFAFDIAFIGIDKKLKWNADLFEKFNECVQSVSSEVTWGGSWTFKDAPHFELKNWKNLIRK